MRRLSHLTVLSVAAVLMGACAEEGPDVQFLSIGTGGTGGIYYPLGGAIANLLSAAEVTGGSVENIARIAGGQIDMGFAISTSARAAFDGDGGVEPVTGLRALAPLYPNLAHVLVRDDAAIESIADLSGRTVSVGSAGSGTEQFSRHLLGAYELDYQDIDARYLSFSESSAALRDGAIDAAILSVGYPAAAVLEATTNAAVRLVPLTTDGIDRMRASYTFYSPATIPAGTYPGIDEDVPTVAVMNWIVGMGSLEDEPVVALLNTLRQRLQVLVRVNGIAAQIDLSVLGDAPIPLHPAAERWLREGAEAE